VPANSRRNRFEYSHLNIDVNELANAAFDERLSSLGRDGWQLVGTVAHERHGYSHAIHFIFVRRMP
jgi:hypothetical protein